MEKKSSEDAPMRAGSYFLTVKQLRLALYQIMQELGVPDNNYPAPIANAYKIAKDAYEATNP